jgi:uncharacterized protein (TIGR02646 family)
MIHIDRDPNTPTISVFTVKSVKALDGTTKITKAEQELEKAVAFFTDPMHYENDEKKTKKSFSFKVYKNPELVEKLDEIFLGKCAYCESRFAHVTPKDIEHFRPKSEIDNGTKKVKPGYYWLAGDWHNLLVSCPDCNRTRNHKVPGQSKKVKLGKSTQFPLDPESMRIRDHDDDVANEEAARLLLNPCIDMPEEYLTFDEDGLIHAHKIGGVPSKKGRSSIDVYALQRKVLVEERLCVLVDLRFQFKLLRHLIRLQNTLVTAGVTGSDLMDNLNQIRAVSAHIAGRLNERAPYLAMLREWVLKAKQAGEFDDLLLFGIDPQTLI